MTTDLSSKKIDDLSKYGITAFDELARGLEKAQQWQAKAVEDLRDLHVELAEAKQQIVAQQAAMQKAIVFINLHHWKDKGTGRKYWDWDLDAAGEVYESLVNCYESIAAHDEKYEGK